MGYATRLQPKQTEPDAHIRERIDFTKHHELMNSWFDANLENAPPAEPAQASQPGPGGRFSHLGALLRKSGLKFDKRLPAKPAQASPALGGGFQI